MKPTAQAAGFSGPLEVPQLYAWRELAIAGLVLMDLTWVALWTQALADFEAQIPFTRIAAVLGGVMVVVHLAARLMNFLHLRLVVRRSVVGVLIAFGVLTALRLILYGPDPVPLGEWLARPVRALLDLSDLFPPDLVVILAVLFVGWRAVGLAQGFIGPLMVMGNFRLGFLMFLGYIFLVTLITGRAPGFLWAVYLFCGIIAIGAARMAVQPVLRGGHKKPFNRTWFLGLLLSVVGTIAFAAGIAYLAAGIGPIVIGIALRLSLAVLVLIFTPIVILMVFLLSLIVESIQLEDLQVVQAFNEGLARLQQFFEALGDYVSDFAWVLEALLALWQRWGPLLKLLVCSSVVALIAGILILRLRNREFRPLPGLVEADQSEVTDDLLSKLRQALRARWQGMLDRFDRRGWIGQRGRRLAAARIRQIYAELLDLATELDKPRIAAQTPLEYLPTLEKLFLGLEEDVGFLTQAYLRVRYGELPEGKEDLVQVEAAWDRVDRLGKSKLSFQKKNLP